MNKYLGHIRDILHVTSLVSSKSDKLVVLEAHKSDVLAQIFQDTYDKSRHYGVREFCVWEDDIPGINNIEHNYDIFHDMLDYISKNRIRGKHAKELIENTIGSFIPEDREVLANVVKGDLKIGINPTK